MGSTRAYTIKDQTQKGKGEIGRICVNFGKVLPATTTGNLFAVTGTIVVTGLFGIVSTVFSASAVKPTLGVTGLPAAIAAAPVAGVVPGTGAVGSVVIMPPTFGGPLPVLLAASGAVSSAICFVVNAANITITTDATNTAAVTWVLAYEPVYPKGQTAAVTAV